MALAITISLEKQLPEAQAAYVKAGQGKSLAREMASRGITVNVVAPGVVQGAMADASFPPELVKQMVPTGRAARRPAGGCRQSRP